MKIKHYAAALAFGVATAATGAFAAETGAPAQPPQTHDIRAAELPPVPGFYYALALGNRRVNGITDDDGEDIFPDTNLTQQLFGISGLYVLPEQFRGGTLGLYGVTSWQQVHGSPGGPLPAVDSGTALVDAVIGVTWSKAKYRLPEGPPMGPPPGFVYSLGLQATIPGGDGSLGSPVISPNFALTYRTDPIFLDGTEFSMRASYNHVTERDSDLIPGFKYKDGDYISIDFAITERYKNFTFGPIGTYMKQIEGDRPGVGYPGPTAGHMEEFAVGAVLNIDLSPTSAIKMRYTKGVKANNMLKGDLFGIQFVSKF